jgi:hypothetical protein
LHGEGDSVGARIGRGIVAARGSDGGRVGLAGCSIWAPFEEGILLQKGGSMSKRSLIGPDGGKLRRREGSHWEVEYWSLWKRGVPS